MTKFLFLSIVFLTGLWNNSQALANWSLNVGYRNPVSSQVGLNFLWLGTDFGFELGIGHASVEDKNEDNSSNSSDQEDAVESDSVYTGISGDLSILYFLNQSSVKFYLQAGFGAGIQASAGEQTSAGASLAGPFAGAGLFAGSKDLYLYLAYILVPTGVLQAGVGFDI